VQALEQKRIDTLAGTLTIELGERTALRRREAAKGDGVSRISNQQPYSQYHIEATTAQILPPLDYLTRPE